MRHGVNEILGTENTSGKPYPLEHRKDLLPALLPQDADEREM